MIRSVKKYLSFRRNPSAGWIGRIHSATGHLSRLNASTEQEFLAVGERLQDFYARARRIASLTSDVAARMSGRELDALVEELTAVAADLKAMGDDSRQGVDILNVIVRGFENIQGPLSNFEKIVKNLQVLGNFVRIESARMRDRDSGFVTLVEDIKKLAVNVELQSKELIDQAGSLRIRIQEDLNGITRMKADLDAQTRDIMADTEAKIESLTRRHAWSLKTVRDFAGRWETITGSIGEIVMSIQFHDITRQQIEHVSEALGDVAGAMQRPSSGENGRRRPLGKGGAPSSRYDSMGTVAAVCELQSAQLEHAGEEMEAAVGRILSNLEGVAGQIKSMSEDIRRLAGSGEDEGRSYLAGLEEGLVRMTGALGRYAGVSRELRKATGRIPETVARMSALVAVIDKIGIDMQIVALNAYIRAEHIGAGGIALGVLADSLHGMSKSTIAEIYAVSGELKGLFQATASLSPGDAGKADEERAVARHLADILKPLHRLDDETAGLIADIDASGKAFADDIESAVAGFTVHEKVRRVIDGVRSELASVAAGIRGLLPAEVLARQDAELDRLAGRYTMARERDIHQTLLAADGAAAESVPGETVLFGDGEDTPQTKEKDAEELGDNVELF